jgi:hypothetical protein
MLAVLIVVVCLSILAVLLAVLPFFAAWHHFEYPLNTTLLTACIGALGGIVTAIIQKMMNGSCSPKDEP